MAAAPDAVGRLRPLGLRQVFLDTETTGLHPDQGDRVVEIGCIEVIQLRPTGRVLHHYLNPERPSDADALNVHGLSTAFLADKPRFAEVASELVEFLADAELVIHNACFDVGFLDAELQRIGLPGLGSMAERVVDSLRLARELYPGKSNSLDSLCKRLGVDNSARTSHGALLDAQLLFQVHAAMRRQQISLGLDAGQATVATPMGGDDLAGFRLQVIEPTAEELRVHRLMLEEMAAQTRLRPNWLSLGSADPDTGLVLDANAQRKGCP